MKILFYFGWPMDEPGGAEIATQTLAAGLAERGHDVCIVDTVDVEGRPRGRRRIFEGPVWSIRTGDSTNPRPPFLQFWSIVSRFGPDIVSVQCPSWAQAAPIVGAVALPRRWRLAAALHGSELLEAPEGQTESSWLDRLFNAAAAVTTVSESLRRDFTRRYPALAGNVRVIPNGLEPHWSALPVASVPVASRAPSGRRYVLYAGRFEPVKGIDILLNAWRLIDAAAQRVELWLAGAGSEEDRLRALVRHLGITEHVRFLGHVDQGALPDLFREAALVVMPSRHEGLPRVALEAGACGAVCIATRVGGVPEIIVDGITGFLAAPESPPALAEALTRGIRLAPAQRRRMGQAARSRILRQFTQTACVAAYEELFASLREPALYA